MILFFSRFHFFLFWYFIFFLRFHFFGLWHYLTLTLPRFYDYLTLTLIVFWKFLILLFLRFHFFEVSFFFCLRFHFLEISFFFLGSDIIWLWHYLTLTLTRSWHYLTLTLTRSWHCLTLTLSDTGIDWVLKFLSSENFLFSLFFRFHFFWDFIFFFDSFLIWKKIKETNKNLNKRIYCSLSKQWLIHQQLLSYCIATSKIYKKFDFKAKRSDGSPFLV